MKKTYSHSKLKIRFLLLLIITIISSSFISGIKKVEPADLLPDPEKAYFFGSFRAFGGDAIMYSSPQSPPVPDLVLWGMDRGKYFEIFLVQDKENNNNHFFLTSLQPGMYRLTQSYYNGMLNEPLNEEFEILAGEMFYLGDYLRSYKSIPLLGAYVSGIQACNHYNKTTGIIKNKYPHFSNLQTKSIYVGEAECTDPHTNLQLIKDPVKPKKK